MPKEKITPVFKELIDSRLVEIYDHGEFRSLYFGGRYLQSRMSLITPPRLILSYTHYMMFSLLCLNRLQRVLLIGIGAGSLVRFLHHHFPSCHIDCVDNSSAVIKLAQGYFQLPVDTNVKVHCMDGHLFAEENAGTITYDLILVDAFDEQGMVSHIYSETFFKLCSALLDDNGVLCCNIWSGEEKMCSTIFQELDKMFTNKVILPVPQRGNVIYNGMQKEIPWKAILKPKKKFPAMKKKYHIDFAAITDLASRKNRSLTEQVLDYLTV